MVKETIDSKNQRLLDHLRFMISKPIELESYDCCFHHLGYNWRALSSDGESLEPEALNSLLHHLEWEEREPYFLAMMGSIIHNQSVQYLDALFGKKDKEKAASNMEAANN
jgi:hypothetical protein